MRNRTLCMSMILCLLLACSIVLAAESAKSLPNLVGTWICKVRTVYYTEGESQSTGRIIVTDQDGAYFRGFHTWEHLDKAKSKSHLDDKLSSQAKEPFIGVVGFDGKIYMVEHGDWGVLHCRLVDADTIETVYVESGPHAAISRAVYTRQR